MKLQYMSLSRSAASPSRIGCWASNLCIKRLYYLHLQHRSAAHDFALRCKLCVPVPVRCSWWAFAAEMLQGNYASLRHWQKLNRNFDVHAMLLLCSNYCQGHVALQIGAQMVICSRHPGQQHQAGLPAHTPSLWTWPSIGDFDERSVLLLCSNYCPRH